MEVLDDDGATKLRRTIHTPKGALEEVVLVPPAATEYGISPDIEKVEPMVTAPQDLDMALCLMETVRAPDFDLYFRWQAELGDAG